MSVLTRFKGILQSQANAIVDQLDDSNKSLDYSLVKLENSRRALSRGLIEVSAARQRLEAQRDQLSLSISGYEKQAQAAVAAGHDDLARIALHRKQDMEARRAELEADIAQLSRQREALKENQINLERKIAAFRSKKAELKAMYTSTQAQLRVREALSGISDDLTDVGNTIQRVESRIQEMQSRADAIDNLVAEGVLQDVLEPAQDDIDRELGRIGRNQAVEEELARLRKPANA